MEDNLLLFSGGIDSRVCVELLQADYNVSGVGFDYCQPHNIELSYAEKIAKELVIPYEIIKLPFLPKRNDIVFCGRNAVMLSMAFAMAESAGIKHVTIGVNKDDRTDFPDCRLNFIKSMSEVGATYGIKLHAPLINHTKEEILLLAKKYDISLASTWTCYSPTAEGKPCGECYSCIGIKNANRALSDASNAKNSSYGWHNYPRDYS